MVRMLLAKSYRMNRCLQFTRQALLRDCPSYCSVVPPLDRGESSSNDASFRTFLHSTPGRRWILQRKTMSITYASC
jgi:hypothetical protein